MRKKVLILTVTAGFGHNSAARTIKNRLLESKDDEYEVETIEVLKEYGSDLYYHLTKDGYSLMMSKVPRFYEFGFYTSKNATTVNKNHGYHHHAALSCVAQLYKKINEFQPDVVYCSHFIPAIALSDLRLAYHLPPIVIMSELDYYNTPFFEAALNVDYFTLPHEDFIEENLKNGFKREQLVVTGIPIDSKFSKPISKKVARRRLKIEQNMFTIMVMFGGGEWSGISKLFEELIKVIDEQVQIIIINGRNKESYEAINKITPPSNIRVVNVGFTDNIVLYMSASDLAVTKAGGLSVTEMIATELPLIIYEKVYAQEAENMHYLISKGMATSYSDAKDLSLKIKEVKENYDYYINNLRSHKRNAVEDIYNIIKNAPKAQYSEEYIASIDYDEVKRKVRHAVHAKDWDIEDQEIDFDEIKDI